MMYGCIDKSDRFVFEKSKSSNITLKVSIWVIVDISIKILTLTHISIIWLLLLSGQLSVGKPISNIKSQSAITSISSNKW